MSTAETIPSAATASAASVRNLAPAQGETPSSDPFRTRAAEAIALWLRWNDVFEKATAAMFERRLNLQQLHESMDQADELRRKAVQLSQDLLEG